MGVYTHLGSASNGGDGRDRGVYCLLPEHGHTVHLDSYYNGIVSGSRSEAETAPIQAMVGAARSRYHGDTGGGCSSRRRGAVNRMEKERDG